MVNKGGTRASKDDNMEFGQQTQLQYNTLNLFDYGEAPTPCPTPISPCKSSAPLQRNVEDDVFGAGNAAVGPVYRGQGRQVGGRAIQFDIVGDDVVVGGGGFHTKKTPNYKIRGWDRSSNMQMLFEDDPARPSHPLHVEMSNKQGVCVLKIRCCICHTLISYHNNLWTYVATHILSHNIGTPQHIAAAAGLAFECEANREPFPIHKLATPLAMKKEPTSDVALIQCNFAAPSYRTDTQPYHWIK